MFDMFNPALREAKRRAKEEYRQRMLQGRIDETMRHSREKADRTLARREKIHRDWLQAKPIFWVTALVVIAFALFGR